MKAKCPNCGAPGGKDYCDYCGTPLYTPYDVVDELRGKLAHVWFENDDGTVHCMDLFVKRAEFESEYADYYADAAIYQTIRTCQNLVIESELRDPDISQWKDYLAKIGRIERS